MESFRQALGAVYFALAEASGGDEVLEHASDILNNAIGAGVVTDPYAVAALKSLVSSGRPIAHDPHGRLLSLSLPRDRRCDPPTRSCRPGAGPSIS